MVHRIKKLLIANRGEIARRIMRSAHNMGISTVAIYADGDVNEPFVREADQAVSLDGHTSLDTYLNQDKVMAAAKRTGVDAIHPGYGFLSENKTFAASVIEAGIIWVGPSVDAIAEMGDKLSSKSLMNKAKVPTLPSIEIVKGSDVVKLAEDIGYPLLVKASAGGGGKGMRIVLSETELLEAVASARREAAAAFGDDRIFLERWLASSRHIEIQVFGDHHGNLVHCFERECSIQRRHQKIIEEAPSSVVNHELRQKMGDAAVAAARAINYYSAGTVEFLVDGQDFWFLEMNTRLQVEHAVTEEITGIDLVREQIRIAQGEKLGFKQNDITIDGHAIEARVYAEDPEQDFLPTSGRLLLFERSALADARYDTGVETGSTVGIEFDPMLAKVIVHAPTREEAALRLARVLETTRITGITSNRDFLVEVLRTQAFLDGDTTTDFIGRINPPRKWSPSRSDVIEACIAAAMVAQGDRRAKAKVLSRLPSGWRNSEMPPEMVAYLFDGETFVLKYQSQRDGSYHVAIDSHNLSVAVKRRNGREISIEIQGHLVPFTVLAEENLWFVHGPMGQIELSEEPRFPAPDATEVGGGLSAPMPGNVVATYVSEGDWVKQGQLLLILEGMKMEHRIESPHSGLVEQMFVVEGDQVSNGQMLVVLSKSGEPSS